MSKPIDIKWSDSLPRRHSVYEDYAMQHNNQQHQSSPYSASYYASIPPGSPPRGNPGVFPHVFKTPSGHSPGTPTTEGGRKPNEISPECSPDPITRLKTAFSKHEHHHASMHSPYLAVSPPLSPSLQSSFPASSATFRRHSISSDSPASRPSKQALRPKPMNHPTQGGIVSPTSPTSNREYFFRERHHIRRPSVAINFSDAATDADEEVVDLKSGVRERRDSFMKRSPSPLAECILKGDFSFDWFCFIAGLQKKEKQRSLSGFGSALQGNQ